jgi:hypothetical protein
MVKINYGWKYEAVIWLVFPLVGFFISLMIYPYAMELNAVPHSYTFSKVNASNGVKLYTLRTDPEHVELKAIDTNLLNTGLYGINGGFFYNGDLLSIAVMDDWPVKAAPNAYGSGWYNTGLARGTLVWDKVLKHFSVQVVESADQLQVANRLAYWAQGGVSMGLSEGIAWERLMPEQRMPAYEEQRLRSGAAFDSEGKLWLIVTPTLCTVEQFRSAILERIIPGKLIDGIFLDGDGSSQFASRTAKLGGDGREVYQMLQIAR